MRLASRLSSRSEPASRLLLLLLRRGDLDPETERERDLEAEGERLRRRGGERLREAEGDLLRLRRGGLRLLDLEGERERREELLRGSCKCENVRQNDKTRYAQQTALIFGLQFSPHEERQVDHSIPYYSIS